MYLTGGQFKGHKIDVPKSAKPTLSKVRESVFNMLSSISLEDNLFLDMFAGSAIMGLEALSRGFRVFEVEINPKSAQIIKNNYSKIKQKPNLTITNALLFSPKEKFDIIYLDPPWQNDYTPIIKKADELLKDKGVIIVEYDKQNNIDLKKIIQNNDFKLTIIKSKKYGRCLIDFLRKDC